MTATASASAADAAEAVGRIQDWLDGLTHIIKAGDVARLVNRLRHVESARDAAVREWKREHDAVDELQREHDALLDRLRQLKGELAAALEGNRRLQTMNEGLRQVAIQAREAADGWHQATIDVYSGFEERHPADCPCSRQRPDAELSEGYEQGGPDDH